MKGPITQERLHQIIRRSGAIRAGATIEPEQRMKQYEYDGYSGAMYYSKTQNMKAAEDKLFEIRVPPENVHTKSNAPSEPGYVYVIVGERVITGGGGSSWWSSCIIL